MDIWTLLTRCFGKSSAAAQVLLHLRRQMTIASKALESAPLTLILVRREVTVPSSAISIQSSRRRAVLGEFGKLLRYYAGWSMRIAFVPEERVTENPKTVVRNPKKGPRR